MTRIFSTSTLSSAMVALCISTLGHASTTISGAPSTTATAGKVYTFRARASDTDRRRLTFTISNKPSWATFYAGEGVLYGVPTASSVGTYSNIVIRASDGVSSATLPAFSITVAAASSSGKSGSGSGSSRGSTSGSGSGSSGTGSSGSGSGSSTGSTTTGSATVNWTPPTQNTNGTSLTNLAGYTINYGTSSTALTSTVNVANPGLTSYVVSNLSAGTYYFTVSAYTSAGTTSSASNVVSKTIQ